MGDMGSWVEDVAAERDTYRNAYLRLLAEMALEPDPFGMFGSEEFTLTELYEVHRAAGCTMHHDTFRRRIVRTGLLSEVNVKYTGGRPAATYVKVGRREP